MMRLAALLGLLGLAVATGVIVWSGFEQVLQALQQAGWGIVWTSLAHLLPMLLCVIGWQALLGKASPGVPFFFYILWLRTSVNNLLPVARIGGEVVSVRVMMKHGIRKSQAVACTVVETTVSVIAQFVYVLLGVSFFVLRVSDENVTAQLLFGLLFSLIVIAALVFVQRVGFFGLLHRLFSLMFRDKWKSFAGNTARLDQAVHTMYKRGGRVTFCGIMQFVAWAAGAFEIWLALYYLGHPVSLLEATMIEALIQGAGSAAFIVPGALGVQEAGFLLFGSMLGLTPEIAAAMAVIRRCRDLLIYVPGLILWQVQEGRWLMQKTRKKEAVHTSPPKSVE
ncbi:MAG: flippase-like domain-containing protein [Alphaproteobacteria bacterium]|nr:flippase-like domain-containing protein [Alphaproteobacteria bacterium]